MFSHRQGEAIPCFICSGFYCFNLTIVFTILLLAGELLFLLDLDDLQKDVGIKSSLVSSTRSIYRGTRSRIPFSLFFFLCSLSHTHVRTHTYILAHCAYAHGCTWQRGVRSVFSFLAVDCATGAANRSKTNLFCNCSYIYVSPLFTTLKKIPKRGGGGAHRYIRLPSRACRIRLLVYCALATKLKRRKSDCTVRFEMPSQDRKRFLIEVKRLKNVD